VREGGRVWSVSKRERERGREEERERGRGREGEREKGREGINTHGEELKQMYIPGEELTEGVKGRVARGRGRAVGRRRAWFHRKG